MTSTGTASTSIAQYSPQPVAQLASPRRTPADNRGSPSRRISTPCSPFNTQPASNFRRANRYTYGRNPTPCTTPRTRMDAGTRHQLIQTHDAAASLPAHLITLPSSTSIGTVRLPPSSVSSAPAPRGPLPRHTLRIRASSTPATPATLACADTAWFRRAQALP